MSMKELSGLPEFYDVLRNRRSTRSYQNDTIPEEKLQRVLDAGRWAPSAHNAQPWRFLVLQNPATKSKLARMMGARLRSDRERDGVVAATIEEEVDTSIARFSQAPVVVVVNLTMAGMDVYPDPHRTQIEYIMAIQSVAAAIQNVLLTAHAEGLAACWYCAPLFCQEVVREALSLSDELYPQAIITLGVPSEVPDAPARLELETVVEFWRKRQER